MADEPAVHPVLLGAESAASMLSLSRRYFLTADASGRIGPRSIKIGRRRLWSVDELRTWAAAGCPHRREWERIQEQRLHTPLPHDHNARTKNGLRAEDGNLSDRMSAG
ncbi:MAG: hypothetical protein WD294_07355 [Phycisphaeraceae bacterium]